MTKKEAKRRLERCRGCKRSRDMLTMPDPVCKILVCHGGQYHGKWTAEIEDKDCPIKNGTDI